MPKVSEDHRKAQEQRFLDAARRCFTRLGVERTSMEEIRTEAGVSLGLMYRYFPSKDDMVHAAVAESLAGFEALISAAAEDKRADTPAGYLRALLTSLHDFRRHSEGVDLFTLAIQGWAFGQSRPETHTAIVESFDRQVAAYRSIAARWTTPARVGTVARALAGAVIGYVVQSAFSDAEVDIAAYCKGLTLLSL